MECKLRIYHRRPLYECKVIALPSGKFLLDVDDPINAVAPGQVIRYFTTI